MSVMMMQTKYNWTTPSYSSNCSIFRATKLETTSTTRKQQNMKNGKVRFRLNIDIRKEMEDSRLNAIKQLITFVKGRLNFNRPSHGKLKLANACWQIQVVVCERHKNCRRTSGKLLATNRTCLYSRQLFQQLFRVGKLVFGLFGVWTIGNRVLVAVNQ